jgi:hypothetical protein
MTRKIHLVFKTHLDIGFTDHAAKVRAQYHERFIPQAIDTGEHFFAENPDEPKFIWTTGAWLIHDHLATQSPERVKRLERAIERGLIAWHALPFTTHTELMSPALFRAGLSYAQELDQRFGKTSIAGKMTDVPGHTLGMVPLLAEAGVKFLHLGVNSASPPPDVPDIFRWRAPDGSEVVVMYQKSYGATHFPEGFDEGLSFAHTNDNLGPQSVPQTVEAIRELQKEYPDAVIVASTLDAYAALLWARREEFPIVDIELGDSWIYGAGSDPDKISRYLSLRRAYDGFDALTPQRLAFGRGLAMVAEHTCGVDIKSYLRDDQAWDRPAFEAARKSDYRFAYTEASWAEQRAYMDAAIAELPEANRRFDAPSEINDSGNWSVTYHPVTGDIASITSPSGAAISGANGSLLGYRYESYDAAGIAAHMDTYLTLRVDWAILDHIKPGLDRAATARSAKFAPDADGRLDADAHRTLGAPARVTYSLRALDDSRLEIAVTLHDKPANRMPEASFVTFTPAGISSWEFEKLGLWQPGDRVARIGGGQLQAVNAIRSASIHLMPLDTPLVAPAVSPFMPFNKEPPDFSGGLRFNLHNNKWGTNFPMWWGSERFTARFVLTLAD